MLECGAEPVAAERGSCRRSSGRSSISLRAEASGDLPDFVEDQKERRLLTVLIDGRDVDPHRLAVWRHASHTFIDDAVADLRDDVDGVLVEHGFGVRDGRLRAVDLELDELKR